MKNRGKCAPSSQPEACGVWLDTAAGKKRNVQTLLSSSAYKLRTPFPRQALSAAVEYGFTQTRTLQLCTHQTTISSFFMTTPPGEILDFQGIELNRSSENTRNKRKRAVDGLQPSSKKSGTTEPSSSRKPADGGLDLKRDWNQLCIPPTEPQVIPQCRSDPPTEPQCCSDPPTEPQESLHPDSNVAEFPTRSLLTPASGTDGLLESQEIRARASFLFPDSQEPRTGAPATHPEPPALPELDVLVHQTSRGLYEVPRSHSRGMNGDACATSAGGLSHRVGCTQTQIDFTQDSEGNVVLAHRAAPAPWGSTDRNNGPELLTAAVGSGVRRTREHLSTKQHSKYSLNANVGPETKENLPYCEPSDSCAPRLENGIHAEIGTCKESDFLVSNSLPDEGTVPRMDSGVCLPSEGSDAALLEWAKCQNLSARPSFPKGNQGHASSRSLKGNVKRAVQKTPLADRTNQLKEVQESGFKPSPAIPSRSCPGDSPAATPPLCSLLFTQDSEGNHVIKHW